MASTALVAAPSPAFRFVEPTWPQPIKQTSDQKIIDTLKASIQLDNGHETSKPKVESSEDARTNAKNLSEIKPAPKTTSDKASAIAQLLNRYRIEYENDWDCPPSIILAKQQIEDNLDRGDPIEMVIPAFPFKSSNKSKILGTLPDEAERFSLLHLENLCKAIEHASETKARIEIVSDGIVYNDLLEVSDAEVWRYGQALRAMAIENDCSHISFSRLSGLMDSKIDDAIDETTYCRLASQYRDQLVAENLPKGYDANADISSDEDVEKTYKGYKKFLELERDVPNQSKKDNARIAKDMLLRGKCFAGAIKKKYGSFIRLSIHPSTDTRKISIYLLPQNNTTVMTPWHGAIVRSVNGAITMSHAIDVPCLTHDIVSEKGRPAYFREKSSLFDFEGLEVSFEYMYPNGIMIRPARAELKYGLHMIDMQKIRFLAEQCSPIVLRGFENTRDKRTYIAKAYDLGPVLPWKSGLIQEVKNEGNEDPTSNSVVSNEAMPMHYDGMFKLIKGKDDKGVEKMVSDTPRFQYFVSQTTAEPGDGFTLFASSKRFAKYLPAAYNIDKMSKIRWTCDSHGFFAHKMEDLPLIVKHPTLNYPCVRWHQPWPKWKTNYGFADISIDNGSQNLVNLIDSLLFDRRVCLYFAWEQGDILVNDNFATLHTRTGFNLKTPRELWRIHTN